MFTVEQFSQWILESMGYLIRRWWFLLLYLRKTMCGRTTDSLCVYGSTTSPTTNLPNTIPAPSTALHIFYKEILFLHWATGNMYKTCVGTPNQITKEPQRFSNLTFQAERAVERDICGFSVFFLKHYSHSRVFSNVKCCNDDGVSHPVAACQMSCSYE